jgi:hypothetical protein
MKLAEAIAQCNDGHARMQELRKRIVRNARVHEGEQPGEDPQALLDEVDRLQNVNRTQSQTRLDEDTTMADAIAERDVLARKRDLLVAVADAASTRPDHHGEVRYVTPIAVGKVQRQVDQLAKRYREIDSKIQELSWRTDLL